MKQMLIMALVLFSFSARLSAEQREGSHRDNLSAALKQKRLLSPFAIHDPKLWDTDFNKPPFFGNVPPGYNRPQDLLKARAPWARYIAGGGLVWDIVEKEKGKYDWSRTDYLFGEGYKAGLNLLVVVSSYHRLYQDCSGGIVKPPPIGTGVGLEAKAPCDMEAYRKFLRAAVERYDGDGIDDAPGSPVINYWEIDNEVNIKIFWGDSPENYANLLKESYGIIKKANSKAKVLIAGMAEVADYASQSEDRDYYLSILQALNRLKHNEQDRYFDIFSLHIYNLVDSYKELLPTHLRKLKKYLKRFGYETPFWITETGDYSGKPNDYMLPNAREKSEREQAANLLKIFVYAISHKVEKVFWATFAELVMYNNEYGNVFNYVGLINNPLNFDHTSAPKLGLYTFKKMAGVLEGSNWQQTETLRADNGIFIAKFVKNGKPVWVVWNENLGEEKIEITLKKWKKAKITEAIPKYESGDQVTDYQDAFNSEIKDVINGKLTLKVGATPIFIQVYSPNNAPL